MLTGEKIVDAFHDLSGDKNHPQAWGVADGTDVDGESIAKALARSVRDKDNTVWASELGDCLPYLTGVLAGVRTTLVALKKEENNE